nr:reverse transcriptase domain-containing protein [Tanacetum cinerariifolium]
MFKQLHINITLADALILIPKYQKILKALLSNKERLLELANTLLNENCSAVILKKLPEKLGDPRKFLIPCGFSEPKCKALANLGASINLMPLSVWKNLGLPELISTRMTLELANRTICTIAGIARDVFVPVGEFTFPAAFVFVDLESDPKVPLILGRPFLRTARALIDVHGEEMIICDEIEYLLNHDPIKEMDSILKDSIDESNLVNLNDNIFDTMPEMFTDEHALDYSSPPLYDEYDDALFEVESSDFLPFPKYDSFLFKDFSKVDALPLTDNEDKVFNPVKSSVANSSSSSEIAKLTHAVNQQTSVMTTTMTAILKQFQATPPPAFIKVVEEICVTCGGAYPYYQCLAANGNTFPELRDNIQGYVLVAAVNYKGNSGYRPPGGIVLDGPSVSIPSLFINPEEDEREEDTLIDLDLADTTSSSPNHLLEEFADEFALITFPLGNDDILFDIEFDLKEIEYLLNHDPIKEIDSILEDSIDESNLVNLNDNLFYTMPEMFTDEHALDYSSPPLYDKYDDDLFEVEFDTEYVYDDPFDSKEDEIKESKLFIDELDPLRSSDFLPFPKYDSFLFEDFSKVIALPLTDNEEKVFNPVCVGYQKPGHLAARLGCAETKVATWDDLAFKLIIHGWKVKYRNFAKRGSMVGI